MKKCMAPDKILVWEARLGGIFCAGVPKNRLGGGVSGDALSTWFLYAIVYQLHVNLLQHI
jgi:hypothetical protein